MKGSSLFCYATLRCFRDGENSFLLLTSLAVVVCISSTQSIVVRCDAMSGTNDL